MTHQKGIRLPYRSDAELSAVFHKADAALRKSYRVRDLAKKACGNACFYTPGLGLIPEAECPVHDRAWVKAGEYRP